MQSHSLQDFPYPVTIVQVKLTNLNNINRKSSKARNRHLINKQSNLLNQLCILLETNGGQTPYQKHIKETKKKNLKKKKKKKKTEILALTIKHPTKNLLFFMRSSCFSRRNPVRLSQAAAAALGLVTSLPRGRLKLLKA